MVTGARAPVALHLARLLDGAGCRVVLADTPRHPIAAASRAASTYRRLPPPRFAPATYADAVRQAIQEEAVDVVIPTCEEVFYLAQVWRDQAMPAELLAPDMGLLAEMHDKHAFIRLAGRLGLAVPETLLLTCPEDLRRVKARSRELVFKPVWSRFATRVLIRPRPSALRRIRPSDAEPWVAQRHLPGEEISAYAIARAGRLTGLAAYRSLYRAGKGAGIAFEPVADPAVEAFVRTIVAGTGWTGQISFDLMRMRDGAILPLECNPRATSGLHFFAEPHAFRAALLEDGAPVRPDVTGVLGVRLALLVYGLPDALRTGRVGHYRETGRRLVDILEWPGDRAPLRAQWRALGEIAQTAVAQRISLQAASTRDIEWNGPGRSLPPQSSIT